MRQGWQLFVAVAAGALAFAPPAFAGTATIDGSTARFDAAAGDGDWISVSAGPTGAVFSDANGRTVIAGAGCSQNGREADCPGVTGVVVALGDLDDKATVAGDATLPVTLEGGPGNDILTEGGGPDTLDGGEGDDWLIADNNSQPDSDSLVGGPGEDRAIYSQRNEPLTISLDDVANDGQTGEHDNVHSDVEIVDGGYEDDTLTGSAGDDELIGGAGDDTLYGLGGDDVLDGWGACGDEHLYGGAGDDTLLLEGRTYADGGADDDTFERGGSDCTLTDTAIGGPGVDTADFSGSDSSEASVSLDDIANDGEDGHDDYRSDIEDLIGSDHGMTLIGSAGPNVIAGGAGDDILVGGGGADVLSGGDGIDVADYSDDTAPVSLTLDGLANDGLAGEGDEIEGYVEDLRGGDGADTLVGDDGDNVLDGGPGADVMRGGAGIDGVDYSDREHAVQADLDGAAGDDGEAGEGDTIGADVEGLFGGSGDDTLTANALDGFLVGDAGNDHLVDLGGEDFIDAGAGADEVEAADGGEDEIHCGAGSDKLWADRIDDEAPDCETVVIGARTALTPGPVVIGITGPGPPSRAPVTPIDRIAPHATLRVDPRPRSLRVRALGLAVAITCDERCATSAQLRAAPATVKALKRRGVRASGVLADAGTNQLTPGRQTLRVFLNATGRRALHRLLAGTYVLTVRVTDAAGNARRLSLTLRFR
jgi:Ca2+-binding RTX toxin-like protein